MQHRLTRALVLSVALLFAVGCADTAPTEPGAEAPPEVALFTSFDLNDCDLVVEEGESIQAAIDDADEDETICVKAGTYPEPLTGFKNGLALRGAGSGAVTIDVSGSGTNRGINVGGDLENVTLEGFTVTNSDPGDFGLKIEFVDELVVRDVVARDNGHTGIDLNKVSNARLIDVRAIGNDGAGVALRDSGRRTPRPSPSTSTTFRATRSSGSWMRGKAPSTPPTTGGDTRVARSVPPARTIASPGRARPTGSARGWIFIPG